jgi:Yqey-like protein
MSLKERITDDMKTAMRAKDSERLGTIRLLQSAMKQKEVDERIELDDAAIVAKTPSPRLSKPPGKTWWTKKKPNWRCSVPICPNACRPKS